MRLMFQAIVERLESHRCAALLAERVGQKSICQPRVLGQQRAVQVAANRALVDDALRAVFAIVSGTHNGSTKRTHAVSEVCPPRVIFESNECSALAVQFGLDQNIADVALGTWHASDVEESGARQLLAIDGRVAAAEQLVPAAHR